MIDRLLTFLSMVTTLGIILFGPFVLALLILKTLELLLEVFYS
jgi:hypothetical protein